LPPHLHFEDVSVIEKPHLSLGARFASHQERESSLWKDPKMIILLIVLILLFGFGGYRMGPGLGYYGGGGLSLILTIVLILLLLKVI
jgi:hypothetical protein